MRKLLLLTVFLLILAMLAGCSGAGGSVVVGAKDYTEQHILGNILALLIEKNTNLSVSLITDMSTDVIFAGIRTGALDVYVDYSGTIYANHISLLAGNHDINEAVSADEVFEVSRKALIDNYNLHMMDKLGFNNTYGIAVRADTAAEFNLRTISDLAKVSSDFIFGGGSEILIRSDGIPNMKIVYDMDFKDLIAMDGVDRFIAVANNEVQVAEAFSTDGALLEFDLVVLEDDKHFFLPYHAAVIIRDEVVQEHPELTEILSRLTGLLTDDTMRNLNYLVDVQGEDPRDVAEGFLRENNLIR